MEAVDPKFFIYARDYLSAAKVLHEAEEAGRIPSNGAQPKLAILAQAVELALKGNLARIGLAQNEIRKISHDLEAAWATWSDLEPNLTAEVEEQVALSWQNLLRSENNRRVESLRRHGVETIEDLNEFGVWTDEQIVCSALCFRTDLSWLSEHHKWKGSAFRYPWEGLDQVPYVQGFDKMINTVPLSIFWGTEAMIQLGLANS